MADKEREILQLRDAKGKTVGTLNITEESAELMKNVAQAVTTLPQVGLGDFRFPVDARLHRGASEPTDDQAFWAAIRYSTNAIGFNRYCDFINRVLCEEMSTPEYGSPSVKSRLDDLKLRPTIHGTDAYNLLKLATEAFLISNCGVVFTKGQLTDPEFKAMLRNERKRLELPSYIDVEDVEVDLTTRLSNYLGQGSATVPYLDRIIRQITSRPLREAPRTDPDGPVFQAGPNGIEEGLPYCKQEVILQHRATCPSMLELIWSYWHEEGMLVQTINNIILRFQNKRRHAQDPLANLTLDPLRPLSNILWGFIQDEYSRLSVQRRCYEYDSQYGITLVGKAVPDLQSADSRSQFIGAFHNLLYRTAMFYREDDDHTVFADAFPLLNALREVHLILAEGAHNQFGDLPWTSRREMLMMQWILARPEMKEFLRGRYSVPYQEDWMGAVDDMKRLQAWTDVTITHFRELGVYGEQILLSIRYGDWIDINDQDQAKNWARSWRPEIQRYMHAYHAVSGVDLSAETVDARSAEIRSAQPSALLHKRLSNIQSKNSLAGPSSRRLGSPKSAGYSSVAGEVPVLPRIARDKD
ncbi:MAG: hypothetical protein ACU843_16355 [Gammaproteobacteria bacterium]